LPKTLAPQLALRHGLTGNPSLGLQKGEHELLKGVTDTLRKKGDKDVLSLLLFSLL